MSLFRSSCSTAGPDDAGSGASRPISSALAMRDYAIVISGDEGLLELLSPALTMGDGVPSPAPHTLT